MLLLSYKHYISKTKNLYMVTLADSFIQSKNSDTKTIVNLNSKGAESMCCQLQIFKLVYGQLANETVVVIIISQSDLQIPVQSVPITTKVVISNPAHGQMYSIQHYVISLSVTCDRWFKFSPGTQVPFTNKTDRHDITEILLTVALNTNPTPPNKMSLLY